jgi:predicted transcriptional regulator
MWTGLPSYALYLQDDLKYERPEDLDELRKLAYEEQDKPYG